MFSLYNHNRVLVYIFGYLDFDGAAGNLVGGCSIDNVKRIVYSGAVLLDSKGGLSGEKDNFRTGLQGLYWRNAGVLAEQACRRDLRRLAI